MTTVVRQMPVLTTLSVDVGTPSGEQSFHLLSYRVPEMGALTTVVIPLPDTTNQENSR